MPYLTRWYIEDKVIYARVWGDQTLEELRESNATMVSFLDKSPADKGMVHIIMNDDDLKSAPVSLSALQQTLQFGRHPRLGWTIMSGNSSPGLRFLAQMLARIFSIRFHRVSSFNEAVTFLKARDATIPWDKADDTVVKQPAKAS